MGRTNYARSALVAAMATILAIVAFATPVRAAEPTFTPVKRYNVVRKLVFPVVGVSKYWSGFGDCRDNCTREHHGVDIMTYGWKGLPVVAATSGTITKVTYDEGNAGCSVRIRDPYGWETRYLHLNNDVPGTDDVGYQCPAPGIEVGAQVEAGQLIGWIGDSGNAETTPAHLHFELRSRSGHPIDPYRSLRRSHKIVYEWLPADPSAASITLSQGNQSEGAQVTFVVSSLDAHTLVESELGAMILQSPVVAVDPQDPQPGLDEIARLGSERIVIFSDDDTSWLAGHLLGAARMVETAALPVPREEPVGLSPDGMEPAPNIPDRFATIVAGQTDSIRSSYQAEFSTFTKEHRSIVFKDSQRAAQNLGQKSWNSPGRYADRSLLWWNTGDGWIGTATLDEAPSPGFAYLTERRVAPGTLAFLGSLAEAPPMPVWKE